MRGVIVFVTGLVILAGIVLLMGTLLEPILSIVMADSAVQGLGWDGYAADIADTPLQWAPLFFIAFLLTWAAAWYFRRERMTAPRR